MTISAFFKLIRLINFYERGALYYRNHNIRLMELLARIKDQYPAVFNEVITEKDLEFLKEKIR